MSPAARDRLAFAAASVAVWLGVGPARSAAQALRDAGLLSVTVGLAFAATLLLLGERLARGRDDARPGAPLLLLTAAAAAWLFTRWHLPEERFHLALYPLLGWLALRACSGIRRPPLVAIALVSAVGLIDEGIQGAHPERTFDWMDVLANAVGGAIVPLLTLPGGAAWSTPVLLALVAAAFPLLQGWIGVAPPPAAPTHEAGPAAPVKATVDTSAPYPGANIVLITIDALRADHVPPWGRAPVPTPTLDAFAAASIAPDVAWAAGSWTSPSMVTLLSGLHPAVHRINGRGLEVSPQAPLPLEALESVGYRVYGHAGDPTENYRNLGIPEELDREDEALSLAIALTFDAPAFVWVHLRDVHAPYDASPERLTELGLSSEIPRSAFLQRARSHPTIPRAQFPGRHDWLAPTVRALYAAEVADADASLARVLDAAGRDDRPTIVVLTADHGEELLEADGIGHASTTLDSVPRPELQRIPLLVRLPDGQGAGRRQPGTIRQQDVLPTLLGLVGVRTPELSDDPALVGVDLSQRLLDGAPLAPGPAWFVTSPCGWQCPPKRRVERVAAVPGEPWTWCRWSLPDEPTCPEPLRGWLDAADALARELRTPISSTE